MPSLNRPGRPLVPIEERFWSRVDCSAGPDACWPWTGSTNNHGYGQLATRRGGSPAKAHRVAYELSVGPIPDGFHVLHSCDNPPCCNPIHLYVGTAKDNARDRERRSRSSPRSRTNLRPGRPGYRGASLMPVAGRHLSAAMVREIRERAAEGPVALAHAFNRDRKTIYNVIHYKTWRLLQCRV